MNNVVLIGRLTRDPEVRYTDSQLAIARFSLAVNRMGGRGQQSGDAGADFINIVVFGKTAENVERYVTKGRLIGVQGRIQTGSYTNKDGNKVYTTEVVAERVEFLEWGDKQSQGNVGFDNSMPEGFESLEEEDLPF